MGLSGAARSQGSGLALAVLSAASFGLSGPLAKSLLDAGWSPNAAVLVRLSGAAAVLVPVALLFRRHGWRALRADAPAVALYGVLAMAGVQISYFNSVRYLPVSIALLLEFLGPLLVVAWVWLVRGSPPTGRMIIGGAVALVGLLLVVQPSGADIAWLGVIWGLAAACCQASFFLLSDRGDAQPDPVVLAAAGLTIGAAVVGVLGLLGVLPMSFTTADVWLAGADLSWLVPVVLIVLVATVVAYLSGIAAISRLGATPASLIALLEVVCATLAAWLLLAEVPSGWQLGGGALILLGVTLTRTKQRRQVAVPDV